MASASGHDPAAESEDQAALRQLAREVAAREVAPERPSTTSPVRCPGRPSRRWPPPTSSG